jgi:peptidoglycan/LPS O-acetylase OafA/YrhL
LPQLDGLRGVAILLVLAWHYYAIQIVATDRSLAGLARGAMGLAWSGVDLFFVLSGFLIAGILLENRGAPNLLRVFYLRRACRILPLYAAVLVLYLATSASGLLAAPSYEWLMGDPLPSWSYATFTQNVVMGAQERYGPGWLGVTWSLAVEEQFYLVIPVLVWLLPRRALVVVLLLAAAAAPLLRHLSPGFHAFVDAPWRADSILLGALLAVLVRWPPFAAAPAGRGDILGALLLAFLLGAALLTLRPEAFGDFGPTWLAALYATLVLIAHGGQAGMPGRVLASPLLGWFGRLSFGIYLIHQPVSGALHGLLGHTSPQIRGYADAGITLLSLAVTLALAGLSFRYFEGPLLRIGHGYGYAAGDAPTCAPKMNGTPPLPRA